MANNPHKTATYKAVPAPNGRRYQFFCDLSGMLVCKTGVYSVTSPEKELEEAWLSEGEENVR